MQGQVNPAQLIFWLTISVNALGILYMAVVVIVESFKSKPPTFLGPKQNLRLQQKIDDQNLMNELFPDGWSYEENEDGTISAYCRGTGDWVFADYPEVGDAFEKHLRDR